MSITTTKNKQLDSQTNVKPRKEGLSLSLIVSDSAHHIELSTETQKSCSKAENRVWSCDASLGTRQIRQSSRVIRLKTKVTMMTMQRMLMKKWATCKSRWVVRAGGWKH